MKDTIIIGSRGSQLALTQSNQIADTLRQAAPDIEVNVEIYTTKGDRILDTPLAQIGGKGLFTKELEVALIDKKIDLAVHSLKDLPTELPPGLAVGAIPARVNPLDAFVSTRFESLGDLPRGARVGTSSLRRKAQLLAFRPDLEILDLRGNVDTRLRRVTDGDFDATLLACAGLTRLDKSEAIRQELPTDIMLPAPGQGALGIEIRSDDADLAALLQTIDDPATRAAVTAERALLEALGGGCQIPLGTLAKVTAGTVTLDAIVCSLDGAKVVRTQCSGDVADAAAVGQMAANDLLAKGAAAIIRAALE